jgi:uncharacterized tellurite resistance protein B-like protein
MELKDLDREARLRLMRFVCAFAWADLEIADKERALVTKLSEQLEFDDDDLKLVNGWLTVPPRPEDVDPMDVPAKERQLLLNAVLDMVKVDGRIDHDEIENLALLEQLLPEITQHD